jgi:hypothetical protein
MAKLSKTGRIRALLMNGEEPILSVDPSVIEITKAYNWYSANCVADDAVKYVIDYLKSKKISRDQIKKVSRIEPYRLKNIGWNCRILSNGGVLPDDIHNPCFEKLARLIDEVGAESVEDTPVVSIQERVKDKTSELISTLEIEIDRFVVHEKNDFDVGGWFQKHGIKPAIAKKIADYYQPLYSEVYDAIQGKNADLRYAYRNWKKPALKKYLEFIKSIISTAETNTIVVKTSRKPRKKKEKPATQLIAKMKYKEKDDALKVSSIAPATIIGTNQLWVFNTKTRALSVYNAMGPAGLQVKGTSIIGYDEKTSITKVVRKPETILNELMDAGKINLRKLMDNITTKPKNANGRINSTTLLLRVVK